MDKWDYLGMKLVEKKRTTRIWVDDDPNSDYFGETFGRGHYDEREESYWEDDGEDGPNSAPYGTDPSAYAGTLAVSSNNNGTAGSTIWNGSDGSMAVTVSSSAVQNYNSGGTYHSFDPVTGTDVITGEKGIQDMTGMFFAGASLLSAATAPVLVAPKVAVDVALSGLVKAAAKDALQNMALSDAQAAAVRGAISRATTSSTINLTQKGGSVVVQVVRQGRNGYQVIESVVMDNGAKTVVQMAYDAAGNLVHYHPKG